MDYFLSVITTAHCHGMQIKISPGQSISPGSPPTLGVPARGRRHGEVRLPDARPHGPVPLHRRPRAVRRLHRLPLGGRRGPASLHVLQDDEGALRPAGRRSPPLGERTLVAAPRHATARQGRATDSTPTPSLFC